MWSEGNLLAISHRFDDYTDWTGVCDSHYRKSELHEIWLIKLAAVLEKFQFWLSLPFRKSCGSQVAYYCYRHSLIGLEVCDPVQAGLEWILIFIVFNPAQP